MLREHIQDKEDWDALEEDICSCPICQHKIRVYWSPKRKDYLLLGFLCHHCETPYEHLFKTALTH